MNRQQKRSLMRQLKNQTHDCANGEHVLYSLKHGYLSTIEKDKIRFVDAKHHSQVQRFHEKCGHDAAEILSDQFDVSLQVVNQSTMFTEASQCN